jgi:hypothetical protein
MAAVGVFLILYFQFFILCLRLPVFLLDLLKSKDEANRLTLSGYPAMTRQDVDVWEGWLLCSGLLTNAVDVHGVAAR